MGKNKFFKKLIVAGLCAVTATATFGVTACGGNNNDDGDSDKHTCNFATAWSSDKDGHWHACLNAGHTEAYTKTEHTDADNDGKCDECEHAMTYATEKVKVDVSAVEAITDGGELAKGSGIYTVIGTKMSIESKDRNIVYNGEPVKTTKWIKTGGTIAKDGSSLKFVIENDNSVIIVYAASASNGTERFLTIKQEDENGALADVNGKEDKQTIGLGNDLMGTAIFSVNAGTYYIGSSSSGVNIAYVAVWEGGKLKETALETKEETAATCTGKGNVAYTKTNFGRFLNSKGESVAEEKVYKAVLGHVHEADMTTLKLPTATEPGSVTILCNNDHTHDFEETLPVLTSDKYIKIDGQEDGKTLYGYSVNDTTDSNGEKVTVSFVTDTVAETKYKYNTVFSNILSGAVPIGKNNATSLTDGIKIYGMTNNTTEVTAWDKDTYSVTAVNNTLTVSDKGYAGNTKKSAFAYLVFDEAITSGVYKIAGSISLSNFGNGTDKDTTTGNWSPLQLISNDSVVASDTFATLRTSKNKELGLCNATSGDVVAGKGLEYVAGTEYAFEIIVDLDSKEVSLSFSIGDKQYKETVKIGRASCRERV